MLLRSSFLEDRCGYLMDHLRRARSNRPSAPFGNAGGSLALRCNTRGILFFLRTIPDIPDMPDGEPSRLKGVRAWVPGVPLSAYRILIGSLIAGPRAARPTLRGYPAGLPCRGLLQSLRFSTYEINFLFKGTPLWSPALGLLRLNEI